MLLATSLLSASPLLAQDRGRGPAEEEQRLRHELVSRLDVAMDLEQVKAELALEMETFEEKGVVSVEGGAACLDAEGTESQSARVDNVTPQVDPTRAVLRVRISIPKPSSR